MKQLAAEVDKIRDGAKHLFVVDERIDTSSDSSLSRINSVQVSTLLTAVDPALVPTVGREVFGLPCDNTQLLTSSLVLEVFETDGGAKFLQVRIPCIETAFFPICGKHGRDLTALIRVRSDWRYPAADIAGGALCWCRECDHAVPRADQRRAGVTRAAAGAAWLTPHSADAVVAEDHLNWTGANPLYGPNVDVGTRFPDMSHPYDADLAQVRPPLLPVV